MLSVGLNYHFGGVKPVPPPPPPEPAPEPTPVKVKKCPDTPLCCIVDGDGCPIDSDKDGVCDGCDKCPDTPPDAVLSMRTVVPWIPTRMVFATVAISVPIRLRVVPSMKTVVLSIPTKTELCDCKDKCPDTPVGVKVDKDGCPIPEIVEKGRTTLEVLFDFDKSTIKGNYSKDIDALADVMKKYEDLNVTIEGHTDNLNRSRIRTTIKNFPKDALML